MSTKSPKSNKQYVWEGEADSSSYTIQEETDPQLILPRGTRITLHLKVRFALVFILQLNPKYLFPHITLQHKHFLLVPNVERRQRLCRSRADSEAREKLFSVCFFPYIHLAGKRNHKRGMIARTTINAQVARHMKIVM